MRKQIVILSLCVAVVMVVVGQEDLEQCSACDLVSPAEPCECDVSCKITGDLGKTTTYTLYTPVPCNEKERTQVTKAARVM